jgi:hypothetical protein
MCGRHAEPILDGVEGGHRTFEPRLRLVDQPAVRGHTCKVEHNLDIGGLQTRCLGQQLLGAAERPERHRVVCGPHQKPRLPVTITGGQRMPSGLAGQLRLVVVVEITSRGGVQPDPMQLRQVGVVGIAHQRMPEINCPINDLQQSRVTRRLECRIELGVVAWPCPTAGVFNPQRAPGHRHHLAQRTRGCRQIPSGGPDGGAQPFGNGRTAARDRARGLDRQQRVAVGRRDHRADRIVIDYPGVARYLGNLAAGKGFQANIGQQRRAVTRLLLGVGERGRRGTVAPRPHQQHRQGLHPPARPREHYSAGLVAAVHVFQDR